MRGGLPAGWVDAKWQEVGQCQNGRAFPSQDYTDEGTRLLRPGNLNADGWVTWSEKNTRCMPEKYAEEHPGFIVGEHEIAGEERSASPLGPARQN